jgi:cyanophycinase
MGTIALAGGGEFAAPYEAIDRDLLTASGGGDVLVLPTGAAYEHPDRAIEHARTWFATLGATATGCRVLTRGDALVAEHADQVRTARFVYLTGGSAMHLRSVLKRTPVWDALLEVVASGGVVAGSSAGAMVLCDPLTDPRGGAFTLGLGMLEPMAVVSHAEYIRSPARTPAGRGAAGFDTAPPSCRMTAPAGAPTARSPSMSTARDDDLQYCRSETVIETDVITTCSAVGTPPASDPSGAGAGPWTASSAFTVVSRPSVTFPK